MPQFFPNTATLYIAGLLQGSLEDSKLRLFKAGLVPSVSTTRAQLLAEEADFTGYPAGGALIAEFLAPIYNPLGGASIDWATVQFAAASPYTTGNVIGGWWLETTGGVVIAVGTFTNTIPLGAAGQGFPFPGSLAFPNGQ